ncbi:unnamed protein product [Mycena citricolor]|uniref:Uncharacterized protein n=1 Tax=Mycena citricolor TaxID=2018698 RepID=A0AAD2HXE6_9AGAR|nr:unnamed protein product [Mycena citricolor]CAK5282433.1 unnamed protein product [Mycena citricolor]
MTMLSVLRLHRALKPTFRPHASGYVGSRRQSLNFVRFNSSTARSSSVRSQLQLQRPPKTILIVNKLRTQPVILAINAFLEHVHSVYPDVRVFHEDRDDIPHAAEVWKPGS